MGVLSEDLKNRIRAYLPKYPRKQAATLPALHLVHEELRTVSNEAIVEIAEILELHPAEVQDTMTFYEFFKGEGQRLGKTRLWVCRGLACMLRGAYELIEFCEQKLGVKCGETTADGAVTLEFA
jgi:NADH-quinone oxidoreductase subunit E